MFDVGVTFGLHVGKEIFSAAEIVAAGLQRTDMIACEAMKCTDIFKTSLQTMRGTVPKCFKQIVKEAEKWVIEPPVVPYWRRRPRSIDNGSDNTRFTSLQQFVTRLKVIDLIVNKIEEIFNHKTLQYLCDIEQVIWL